MPNFNGVVQIQDGGNNPTLILDGDNGDLTVGGSGQDGSLLVTTGAGTKRLSVDGTTGTVVINAADGDPLVTVDGALGDITVFRKIAGTNREVLKFTAAGAELVVGGDGTAGDLVVRDAAGAERIRLEGSQGDILVQDAAGNVLFQFDSGTAAAFVGGQGNEGDVVVRDAANQERIKLDAGQGDIWVKDASGNVLFQFDSGTAAVFVGGQGNEGDVVVRDAANKDRIKLDAGEGDIWVKDASGNVLFQFDSGTAAVFVGGQGNEGDVVVRDAANKERIKLDAGEGDIWVKDAAGHVLFQFDSGTAGVFVGGQGNEGDVVVRDGDNRQRIKLDGGEGDIWVKDAKGSVLFQFDSANAGLFVGGPGNEGDVVVRDGSNRQRIKLDSGEGDIWVKDANGSLLFHFDSQFAALYVGGRGNEGDVVVRDEANRERIKLDAGEGDIWVKDTSGNLLFHFDSQFAALFVGGVGNEGDVVVRNGDGNQTIKLDGGLGDIILNNADAAEDFDVASAAEAAPGMVMVLAEDGRLVPCSDAYDRKVVGVVSGAGQYRPGLVLDRGEFPDPRRAPISMMGKVACRADATYGRIGVGDLLTTSPSPGCAMKVSDPARAFGAVIGKALSALDEGEGFVSMIISLQ